MLLATIYFLVGTVISGVVALVLVKQKGGEVSRAAVALGLAFLPFGLALLLMRLGVGPAKSIANLIEFGIYGLIGGAIPLGQLIKVKGVPGEMIVAGIACIGVTMVYMLMPVLPETRFG